MLSCYPAFPETDVCNITQGVFSDRHTLMLTLRSQAPALALEQSVKLLLAKPLTAHLTIAVA